MAAPVCQCGFGEEYFTLEGDRSLCAVCGGEVIGRPTTVADGPAPARGKRILVVDDQPFFRARIRDILEQKRHQVVEAGDGVEAVRQVALALRAGTGSPADRLQLVILDLNLPGLIDGFQTLGVLKAMDEELPVFVLTASPPTPDLLKRLGQLKAKKYLNKASRNIEELLARNLEELA